MNKDLAKWLFDFAVRVIKYCRRLKTTMLLSINLLKPHPQVEQIMRKLSQHLQEQTLNLRLIFL